LFVFRPLKIFVTDHALNNLVWHTVPLKMKDGTWEGRAAVDKIFRPEAIWPEGWAFSINRTAWDYLGPMQ